MPGLPIPASPHRWRRDAVRRRLLATADLGVALLATALALVTATDSALTLGFVPIWIAIAKLIGLYDRDHRALRHLTVDELPLIVGWAVASSATVSLLADLLPTVTVEVESVALTAAIAMVAAPFARGAARMTWWRTNPPERTLVVGRGEPAAAIRRKIELFSDMHFDLTREIEPSVLSAGPERAERIAATLEGVDRVIVADTIVDADLIGELVSLCRVAQVKLSVISPLRGRAQPAARVTQLADLPILEYNVWDVSRSTMLIKRVLDVAVATVMLALALPLLPLIVLAIKLEDRGPILFSQVRAGLHGRPFRMYKLRTMHVDAERRLDEVVALDELIEPVFKLRADPRITRVGAFLRRFSLDELPQLLNVVLGEMSIVGPRPEQVELVARYAPEHRFRLQVKPGITGPMQIYGRGELSFEERLAVELDYVQSLSFARDVRIMLMTIPTVIRGNGAF